MDERFIRTEMLIGTHAAEKLRKSRVAVFGVGGVGGYVVEALARSGIGTLDIIDKDTVSVSNINRQIIALTSTIGKPKVHAAADRIHDIDPKIVVNVYNKFYTPETADDPTQFEITDIYKTSVCPLARVMRKELKARGIKHLTVVYSKEQPRTPYIRSEDPETHKIIPASIAFVPSAVGLIIASKVISDLCGEK